MSSVVLTSRSFCRASKCQQMLHRYGHNFAIARDIPDSFVDALSAHSYHTDAVSLDRARAQHAEYIRVLREHVPTFCLPALEEHPDCVFVEDTVVAIGDTACMTRPGHVTRQGEVDTIKETLQRLGIKNLVDMQDKLHKYVICDGGDVLYTGRHLFVGMSDRTNEAGLHILQEAFQNEELVPVPPVVQGRHVLHLKSAVTHLDESTLLAPEGAVGDSVLEAMRAIERGYQVIRLPNLLACNVVAVNGHVLAQDVSCEVSKQRIEHAATERNLALTFVDTSELAKKDAALTCCSVLLNL